MQKNLRKVWNESQEQYMIYNDIIGKKTQQHSNMLNCPQVGWSAPRQEQLQKHVERCG